MVPQGGHFVAFVGKRGREHRSGSSGLTLSCMRNPTSDVAQGWSQRMNVPLDIARRVDPMVSSAEHVKDGGQKSVFRFEHDLATWALKMVDLTDTLGQLGETADVVIARVNREVGLLRDIASTHLPSLGPLEPRIVDIDGGSYFAYSEEYIEGTSLSDLIATHALEPKAVAAVAREVGMALAELWERGVVHRDVKPENILRRESDGSYVLVDPGYALDLAEPWLTRAGGVVGTAPYCSPEQLDVGNKHALDVRSDLYSLGVTMYEAVAGSHPYYRAGMSATDLYHAIREQIPVDPRSSGCPDGLARIIVRLMRKRPHLRYRAPGELLEDLETIPEGEQ